MVQTGNKILSKAFKLLLNQIVPDYAKFLFSICEQEINSSTKNELNQFLTIINASKKQLEFAKQLKVELTLLKSQMRECIVGLIKNRNNLLNIASKIDDVNKQMITQFEPEQIVTFIKYSTSIQAKSAYHLHKLWGIPVKPIIRDSDQLYEDALTESEDEQQSYRE